MTLVGVVLVGLQLMLAGAWSWHSHDTSRDQEHCHHQHDEERAPHDPSEDCTICVAVDMMGQATFHVPTLVETPEHVEIVAEPALSLFSRDEVVAQARGPPVLG